MNEPHELNHYDELPFFAFRFKKLIFQGESEGTSYELNFEFYKPVDPKAYTSMYKVFGHDIQLHIVKQKDDKSNKFWPHLMKDVEKEKNHFQVTTDWNLYMDEDETGNVGFDTSHMEGAMPLADETAESSK